MHIYDGIISKVKLGRGGYDNAMYGLALEFKFDSGSGCSTFIGAFRHNESALISALNKIENILQDAGVSTYIELLNKRVNLYFNGSVLFDWRFV